MTTIPTPSPTVEARARVAAATGALLLDRHRPGWARRITRPVAVDSVRVCPVGQVYGSWGYGILRLVAAAGPEVQDTERYGFMVSWGDRDYLEAVNAAWEAEVRIRRRPLGRVVAMLRRWAT
jgi:hypothetical protein